MNGYQLAIVAFVTCLAAGINAQATTASGSTPADFNALNEYLESNLKNYTSEANFELIEREVDNLEGGVKRAAQIFLAIREVKECNEQVRSMMTEIRARHLLHSVPGYKRYKEMIKPHLKSLNELCAEYIEQTVADKYAQLSSDASVAKLAQVVNEDTKYPVDKTLIFHANATERAGYLQKLAQDEGTPIAGNRANFDRAFSTHISKPCRKLTSGLEGAYKEAELVADVYKNWLAFLHHASDSLNKIIWAYTCCMDFASMNNEQKTAIFEQL